jgi:hemoglobin-like flavoprotein
MTQEQKQLVKSTWSLVESIDPVVVGGLFYNQLFEIAPELKHMFRKPVDEQSKKLLAMIGYIISRLDRIETVLAEVERLASRHVSYGVKPEHYATVGDALLWTLEKGLGKNWNEEVKEAWTACYLLLANVMINATEEKKQEAA